MEKLIEILCRVLTWIGGILMIGAIFVTVGDVVARALLKTGYIGLVDVTQFAVIGFAYLAMPLTFLKNEHVAIGLYDHHLSKRADSFLKGLANLITIAVVGLIVYFGWAQASRTLRWGDVSQNIEIPMILFWVMVLGGLALSLAVCVLQLTQNIVGFVVGETRHD